MKSFIIGIFLVGCFVAFLIIVGATPKQQLQRDRQEAIAHGAAHYVVNPTNGEVTFEWYNNTNK